MFLIIKKKKKKAMPLDIFIVSLVLKLFTHKQDWNVSCVMIDSKNLGKFKMIKMIS